MPEFKLTILLILEKKLIKGFYHMHVYGKSFWPCVLDDLHICVPFFPSHASGFHIKFGVDWPIDFREGV